MKASDQFILRNVVGENLLIPTGKAALDVKGMILLSESGVLLYNKLQDGWEKEDLVAALTEEYEVSEQEAARDTEAFLEQMRQLNILLED